MITIRDMLVVNQLEKKLGRPLTAEEASGEPFVARGTDGVLDTFRVPLLKFPHDLLDPYALSVQVACEEGFLKVKKDRSEEDDGLAEWCDWDNSFDPHAIEETDEDL